MKHLHDLHIKVLKRFQLAGGRLVGYLQAWPSSWTKLNNWIELTKQYLPFLTAIPLPLFKKCRISDGLFHVDFVTLQGFLPTFNLTVWLLLEFWTLHANPRELRCSMEVSIKFSLCGRFSKAWRFNCEKGLLFVQPLLSYLLFLRQNWRFYILMTNLIISCNYISYTVDFAYHWTF